MAHFLAHCEGIGSLFILNPQVVGSSPTGPSSVCTGHPCRSGAGQDLGDLNFGAVFDRGAHVEIGVGVKARAEPDRVAAGGP